MSGALGPQCSSIQERSAVRSPPPSSLLTRGFPVRLSKPRIEPAKLLIVSKNKARESYTVASNPTTTTTTPGSRHIFRFRRATSVPRLVWTQSPASASDQIRFLINAGRQRFKQGSCMMNKGQWQRRHFLFKPFS